VRGYIVTRRLSTSKFRHARVSRAASVYMRLLCFLLPSRGQRCSPIVFALPLCEVFMFGRVASWDFPSLTLACYPK
jgi:hypothetical protein